jgi:hypothetical protein
VVSHSTQHKLLPLVVSPPFLQGNSAQGTIRLQLSTQQNAVVAAGGLEAVLQRLLRAEAGRQEAAAGALVALTRNNAAASREVLQRQPVLCLLAALLKDRNPATRLQAASCLVNLRANCGEEGSRVPQVR